MEKENNLDQQVYLKIREAILNRKLKPGMKISALSLSRGMGVSRTPTRIALQRLASEGLVEMHANRAASIARPSAKQISDVFFVRATLEAAAASLACHCAKESDTGQLRVLAKEEQTAFKRRSLSMYLDANNRFHMYIANISGNEVLRAAIEQILNQSSVMLSLFDPFFSFPGEEESADNEEHLQIIESIEKKDETLASVRMKEHILRALSNLPLEDLEKNMSIMPRLK